MGRTGFSEEEMNGGARSARAAAVGRMHDAIVASGGPFMMGAELTLADIAIMPVIVRLDDINLSHHLGRQAGDRSLWLKRSKRAIASLQADLLISARSLTEEISASPREIRHAARARTTEPAARFPALRD